MSISSILFDKSHFISPFTIPEKKDQKSIQLTTLEKTACVALLLFIGFYTAGVGGVIIFYLTTATIKALKLNNQPDLPSNQPPSDFCHSNRLHNSRIGRANFYSQDEIIEEHSTHHPVAQKTTLRQEDRRSKKIESREAVTGMLILDTALSCSCNLSLQEEKGDTACIEEHMLFDSVIPLVNNLSSGNTLIADLQDLIAENGPAIVSINNNNETHFIIVDEINHNPSSSLEDSSIRLRDPLPGKDLTITLDAFSRVFKGGDVIQAKKK